MKTLHYYLAAGVALVMVLMIGYIDHLQGKNAQLIRQVDEQAQIIQKQQALNLALHTQLIEEREITQTQLEHEQQQRKLANENAQKIHRALSAQTCSRTTLPRAVIEQLRQASSTDRNRQTQTAYRAVKRLRTKPV